jgi:Zn-dependent M28 family amino/carboxypeptidase
VAALVETVSALRLEQSVRQLAAFGTRHTLSDTASAEHGIGAAREWMLSELRRASSRLQVAFDIHHLATQGRITRPVELRNVIAVLPGRTSRRIYITAHYDTVNVGPDAQIGSNTRPPGVSTPDPQLNAAQDYNVPAPGANDNGSGTALTMELARVLAASGLDFDATLVFALWAGEEQGLFGSRAHAQRLQEDKIPVEAVLNNDIVGGSRGGDGVVDAASVRLYAQGPEDSMSRSLARYIAEAAATYVPLHTVRLMAREDRFSRGSDHSPFAQCGFPAVVFRESKENFTRQHGVADTPEGVDFAYLAQNGRVNIAAVALLALAPPAPRVVNEKGQTLIGRQPSGYDANLRWLAAPGAVEYRVYRRNPWTLSWESSQTVGDVTEFVVTGTSIDDWVFGVSAVGPGGHESLISAWVPRSRADAEIRFQAR